MSIQLEDSLEIIYLAGHFDGEGCVRLHQLKRQRLPRTRITVSCSYKPVLERYQNQFGGNIYPTPHASTNKLLYKWLIQSYADIQSFLTAIMPYLDEKKPQAKMMLEYVIARLNCNANRNSLPEEIYELANKTFHGLKELKL